MSYNNPYPQGGPQVIIANGYPPAPKGMSVTSLVLGLVSLFFGWLFLVPIIGLIFGILGAKKEPAGRGMAIAGIVINSVIMAGWVALLLFLLSIGILGATSSATAG